MTRAQAQRTRRHLLKLREEVKATSYAAVGIETKVKTSHEVMAAIDVAVAEVDKLLARETCPGCKQQIVEWYDHAANCTEA